MIRIGVIITMKHGIEPFIYRELTNLEKKGTTIRIFPTKQGKGLYSPRPNWSVVHWSLFSIVISHVILFLQKPILYIKTLIDSIQFNGLADFLLAGHFSLRMNAIDLIYSEFGDHKFFVGYYCKQLTGLPLAVIIHAYELTQNPNPRLFIKALNNCDQIITISEYNREYLHEYYQIDPARVNVVRLSIDLELIKPENKFVILIVAFFTEKKGHDILLKAIKKLGREDVEIWVVGDSFGDKNNVDVQKIAKELGVDSQVVFWGQLKGAALKALYLACDVFCLPSRVDSKGEKEGFPTVLIEAMAYGIPIITTRHVEIPRIIPEILVDENDVDGLAEAIESAYHSPQLLERLGKQNRSLAEKYFSLENINNEYELFLQTIQSASKSKG